MPTASGAAGRLESGADAGHKTWTLDGLQSKGSGSRKCDSYLQRYQEQKKKHQMGTTQTRQESTQLIDPGSDDTKLENPPEDPGSEDPAPVRAAGGQKGRKSSLCVLL